MRLVQAGAVPNTTVATITEWFRDWAGPLAPAARKRIVPFMNDIALQEDIISPSRNGQSGWCARGCSPWGGAGARGHFALITSRHVSSAVDFDRLPAADSDAASQLCALDDALEALARIDRRRAQVIELRFFGGLSVEETSAVLGVSPQTVMLDWKLARAWLARELTQG
jgi:hypothetical protein